MKKGKDNQAAALHRAVSLAAAGKCGPLCEAMKYDRDAVLDLFRLKAKATDARVDAGIEENRKGWLTLLLKDAQGRPCETARVKIRQKSHDFKYGANLFMLDEIPDSAEKNEAYKELFAAAFNLATVPFYWSDLEPVQGKPRYAKDSPRVYRRPAPDLCVEWCEAHGIEPKAHCLNYIGLFSPSWSKGDLFHEKRLIEKRFCELSERYAHRIPMWEVTNETLHWKDFCLNANNFFAEPDLVEWSFKTAERYFAANKLVINEAGTYVWRDKSVFKGCREEALRQGHADCAAAMRRDGARGGDSPCCSPLAVFAADRHRTASGQSPGRGNVPVARGCRKRGAGCREHRNDWRDQRVWQINARPASRRCPIIPFFQLINPSTHQPINFRRKHEYYNTTQNRRISGIRGRECGRANCS